MVFRVVDGNIKCCLNSGEIIQDSFYSEVHWAGNCGGITGSNQNSCTITECANKGNVTVKRTEPR